MPKIGSRANVVFRRDFSEYQSWKSFKLVMILFILATMAVCGIILLSGKEGQILQLTLANTLFLLALVPPIVNIPIFTTAPLTRDKENRTIANLLVTPLHPREIVQGKSLAVFLPGYLISFLSPLFVALVVNVARIVPAGGSFYLPPPLLLAIFVITPVFCYSLTTLTIQLSMITSPELAILPSYLLGFALLLGLPIGSGMGIIDLASWPFLFLYAGAAILMRVLVWSFSFLLTKERIILSN
ncbi:hypothetical protein ABD76_00665 [Paenibacillus dendritiformis]|uniref:hypothetical protein n=1 Tax=Paenibacillus dendritiformis TaxID=130049 RepID=UPI0018CD44DC|nr:hypothetical protein [Paenibacillus dendritiformis]MBG9791122.1 hypothetical protein [Paenibacillus dendritiformis]